jgi:hypothetical protein
MVTAHCIQGDGQGARHFIIPSTPALEGFSGLNNLTAVIVATRLADVVRQLDLAAVRALDRLGPRQGMMSTAHIPPRGRGFSLRYRHLSISCLIGAPTTGAAFRRQNILRILHASSFVF